MELKLVTKKNLGIIITLIFLSLLSVHKFFNLMVETPLGRIILILFVILISCSNKILGLTAVLFVIIAFNYHNENMVQPYNYYEGFDVSGNNQDPSGNIIENKINILKSKENILKTQLNTLQQQQQTNNSSQTATTTSSMASSNVSETFKGGREGFGIIDRESNMLRGKQSNSIPVYNSRNQSDDISPSDKSDFSTSYSLF